MKKVNKQQEAEIIEKYFNQNKNSIELSKEYGFSPVTICKVLKRNGINARDRTQSNRRYPIKEDYFDNIDTQEKAYIMGLLYADGYNDTSRNSVNLSLKESDKQILEDITNIIQPDKPLQFIKIKKPNCENQYRLAIANKHISQKISEYGCMKAKTFLIEFPEWLNKDLTSHFVRGYLDGDGWVGKRTISFVGTEQFLDKLAEIFKVELNLSSYKRKRHKDRKHNIYMLEIHGRKKCAALVDWLYNDARIFLQRKFDAAINLKNYYLNNMYDKHTASSAEIKVCGEGSSMNGVSQSYSPSVKQKSNRKSK